ncbi:MAG: hypothetical protein IJ616_09590 [Bacteroidales bacterium]|nr:hypothetical protein [Bacteroidales bacterium]
MMKKLYIYLLAAAAAVVSCAKENFVEPSENNFRIAVAETDATKSYLNDHYQIVWERGADKVSLFLKTDNNCLTATTTGTTTYLEKAGELAGTTSKWAYALYPYDADATHSTGTITTTLPAAQKAIPNQYSNIIAVGASDLSGSTPTPIHFQTCVTLVEVDLQTDGVKTISLRGNNGETLAGTLRMTVPSADDKVPDPTIVNGLKEVSLSDNGKVLAKGKYYLAIAPQEFPKGLRIILKGDAFETEKLTTNPVSAIRGKRLIAGALDLQTVPTDSGFSLTYDDGDQSGILYPGASKTFVYSYSGINAFRYKLTSDLPDLSIQYALDGGAWQATSGGRLAVDMTADGSLLNLLPTTCTGGTNANNERLQNAAERGSKAEPVDLSTDNNSLFGLPLSGVNTANCYVVQAPGWYSFPLVYGNAIKNGSANTQAYNPGTSGKGLATFVGADGQAITSPYINNGSQKAVRARLEWQDVAGLVADEVSLVGSGNSADKIVFQVPKAFIREGNALISALAADGSVIWSWHIWVSGAASTDFAPVTLTNANNTDFPFMRINLGWVAPYATPLVYPGRETKVRVKQVTSGKEIVFTLLQTGASLPENELGNCPFYQWGRKDPFVAVDGKLYPGETAGSVQGKKKTWYNASRRDTIGTRALQLGESLAAFISNPTVYNVDSKGDNKYSNLWHATRDAFVSPATKAENSIPTVKTVYDPCPVGACLPPIGAWSGLKKDNVSADFNHGFHFYTRADKQGELTWYPALGSLSTSNPTSTKIYANVQNFGISISYWSANANLATSGYYLSCYNGGAVNINYGSYRQYVYPIRPGIEQ